MERFQNITVLVVEDDSFQSLALVQLLKRIGIIKIMSATDGQEALAVISQYKIDIIICDLSMPNMDGLALIRCMSERDFQGSVLLLSAMEECLLRSAAKMATMFNLNILGAIAKPVDPSTLQRYLLTHFDQGINVAKNGLLVEITPQEMDVAFVQHQLRPYFQAQVSLKDGSLHGFESLVRWQHSKYGLLTPDSFLELVEQSDHTLELTELMFQESIKALNQMPKPLCETKIAINILPKNLLDSGFQSMMMTLSNQLNDRKKSVTVEVTEQNAIENPAMALEVLSRLRMHGFNLSIDDFGTGYSTMEQLSKLPYSELKIDREFVSAMDTDPEALIIVESCIRLAKKLKLETVAEGVENSRQWLILKQLGCDYCQGYFVSKPIPPEAIPEQMKNWEKKHRALVLAIAAKKASYQKGVTK